jgi:hypothetical protein
MHFNGGRLRAANWLMAKIYNKGGTEHVLINAVREAHYRPFQATDWTDLRVGFFLSLCGNADPAEDDNPSTGVNEDIPIAGSGVPWSDRVQIGVTDRATGTVFCGYSNLPANGRLISLGQSKLVSSDIGVGTTNARYWRPSHGSPPPHGDIDAVHIIDGGISRSTAPDGSQPHFVQDPATAGGYCTLFALRFTRSDAHGRSRIITMQVKKTASGHSSDILFNTDPSVTILESQLESFPTTVNTLGPIELSHVPDTMWFYWPFLQSRLRIHCCGILKVA